MADAAIQARSRGRSPGPRRESPFQRFRRRSVGPAPPYPTVSLGVPRSFLPIAKLRLTLPPAT